ncbi:MAG: MauE/DoxX family redox-associated membrane protein [Steroidobacterales bacterium]
MDPLIMLTISLALAALLAGAAAHKVLGWAEWQGTVLNYRLVPAGAAAILVVLLPCGEALAAVLLLVPFERPVAACATAALLVLYATALAVNIARGRTAIDCGCFGSRRRHGISGWMVGRNILLAGLALALCLPPTPRPLSAAEVLLAVGIVITVGFLYPVVGVVMERPLPRYEDNYRRTAPQAQK